MIHAPSRARIYLAAGITDMRKDIPGLTALVKAGLDKDPLSGDVFVFRGRSSDQIKALWFSGDGINLYIKRLERGKFIWPGVNEGSVQLTAAQFSMLVEAIDWRSPQRTWWPSVKMA